MRFGSSLVLIVLFSRPVLAQVPPLDAAQAQDDAVHFLAELIRIDTQNPPGNESKVAHYLEGVVKDAGIEAEILETVPGRDSIVARLKGDGSKRPLLLLAHEDVVPVDRSHWTVDPFAAIERNGMIWGRGASEGHARRKSRSVPNPEAP